MSEKSLEVKLFILRLGRPTTNVIVPRDTSIGEALKKAGINLNDNEKLYIDDTKVNASDRLTEFDDTETISVVSPKQGGSGGRKKPY